MEPKFVSRRVFYNPIFRDKATVLKSYEDTGGLYTLGELEIAPGGRNSFHIHTSFEETFTAVRGELGVALQDRTYLLKPGESITVPKNTPHHFVNKSNEHIICHVKFVPGHEDFFKGLAIGYGLACDGKTNSRGLPKSLTHLAMLMVLTNTKPAGFLMKLFPLFKWLATRARKNGMQQLLLEKYYYQKIS